MYSCISLFVEEYLSHIWLVLTERKGEATYSSMNYPSLFPDQDSWWRVAALLLLKMIYKAFLFLKYSFFHSLRKKPYILLSSKDDKKAQIFFVIFFRYRCSIYDFFWNIFIKTLWNSYQILNWLRFSSYFNVITYTWHGFATSKSIGNTSSSSNSTAW